MRSELLSKIERETKRHRTHGDGYLAFKANALVDKQVIQALYAASQAGVKIDLQIRGICALRPGIPGISDTITVTSVVGRFLEHTRIYYFFNGGGEELYVGSADLMPRNLNRRVELLFPLEGPDLTLVRDAVLNVHLKDTAQARLLHADGTYERLDRSGLDSQKWLLDNWGFRGSDLEVAQLHPSTT
jgi:polyphosphate kinase